MMIFQKACYYHNNNYKKKKKEKKTNPPHTFIPFSSTFLPRSS